MSLRPQLKTLSLSHQEEVYHQNGPLSHVYFPTDGVFSTVVLMANGERIEATAIGKEGMVGVSAALGLLKTPVTSKDTMTQDVLKRVDGRPKR